MHKDVVIIGAGMAGCFMAICLAKRGYKVHIYEHRPDVRKESYDSGRSFNVTLYYRGILAMRQIGIWEEVKKHAIIAQGNVAHYGEHKIVYDPFDAEGDEILYTVHRNQLNGALLNVVDTFSSISVTFNTKCVGIDSKTKTVTLQKIGSTSTKKMHADLVIGADGIHSTVRSEIMPDKKDTAVKEYEDWGYKEVHISHELTTQMQLRTRATHTWPRQNTLLIAFPNPDDSFTLMFNLPLEGKGSFATLAAQEQIETYILEEFPDLKPLLPNIISSLLHKPTGKFITLRADTWHDEDFAVVIGDAAHAVIPFYGQGVCAAFEDCLIFSELVEIYDGNWKIILPEFQKKRKINTDLLAQLSKDNFIELRDKSRSPYYILKDKANTLLHRIFPHKWLPPLYVLIAHGSLEYQDALQLYAKQERLEKRIGLNAALYILSIPFLLIDMLKGQ
ncbi:MAG: FAD-dependent oxidoreductase [Candidatus Levyibacteriota bacterium]